MIISLTTIIFLRSANTAIELSVIYFNRVGVKMIYLDNAATTRISSGVADVMTKAMLEQNANPSAIYEIALDNRAKIEQARKDIDETEKDVKIFINKLAKAVITLKEIY